MNLAAVIALSLAQTPLWCTTTAPVDPELGNKVRALVTSAPETGDAAFLASGKLNPDYPNWMVTLTGPVVGIRSAPGSRTLFRIEPIENCGRPVWVSTFVPVAEGAIQQGDQRVFKGFIYRADALDASGGLGEFIDAPALLLARTVETLADSRGDTQTEKTLKSRLPESTPAAPMTSQGVPHD
jgi:hypothetical protein